MSRYLTPAKVGLLALIELYVEGAIPNDGIVPVIDFLTSQLTDCDLNDASSADPAGIWAKTERKISLIQSLQEFEKILAPLAAIDGLPGRRLWDKFLEKLWGIDSLHALQEFFDQLPSYLAKTKEELRLLAELGEEPPSGVSLSRNSLFGAFVRRSSLEYSRLQFNNAADLWKAYVKYRQPTAEHWRRRHPQHGRLSFDSVLVAGEHEWGHNTDELAVVTYGNMLLATDLDDTTLVSTDDIESLLNMGVEQVHHHGKRVPPALKSQFRDLLKQSHAVPDLSHYLNFSDTWKAGDYPTTFDDLHRYFDYTIQSRDKLFYQYALMNMAMVQADFGCHKEAVATMLEAVSTARENRDVFCLNHALSWLSHFGRTHPKLVRELESNNILSTGKEALSFLRIKAKEAGQAILWSSALLGEANLGMSSGESISTALENMVRSSQLIVERNMIAMMGCQLAVVASLWDRLGLAYMSEMTSQVFLRCHAKNSSFDDELKAFCRLAGLLSGKGKYEEAFGMLESMDKNSLRGDKTNQFWHLYRGLLKLRRDLHHSNLDSAEHILSQLLQIGQEILEPDMIYVIDTLHIELLIRRNDFEAAFTKIDRLITELREDDRDISHRIRLLLYKARLFDCIGRPEKGFTIVMRAVSMAWRARLLQILWQAIGALANILNALGEFAAAAEILIAVLPRCLESDGAFIAGMLYSILADAWTGQAGEDRPWVEARQMRKRDELMVKAHGALDSAFGYFSQVEDVEKQCEMMAKKATLMKAVGDSLMAEEYAAKFLALKREGMARIG